MDIFRNTFTFAVFLSLVAGAAAPLEASLIYLSDECNCSNYATTDNRYGVLDTSTGNFTVLSTAGNVYYGLAYDNSGDLYGSTSSSLDILNPGDGSVASTIASGPAILASPVGGGPLFDVSDDGNLYSVNPVTGAQTLIGSTGLGLSGDYSIAFGPDNVLYLDLVTSFSITGSNAGNSELYSVNTATGTASEIAATGNRLTALVGADGVLYGFTATSANGQQACIGCPEALVVVNTATGALTSTGISLLQPVDWGGAQVQSAVEAVNSSQSTPEPGTSPLLLTGAALFELLRRSKRSNPTHFEPDI